MSNPVERLSLTVDKYLKSFFGAHGKRVAENPGKTIIISIVGLLIICSGVTQMEKEDRANYLWTPQGTDELAHSELIDDIYAPSPWDTVAYIQPKSGGNALTIGHLRELLAFNDRIVTHSVNAKYKADPAQDWDFDSLCYKRSNICYKSSILDAWDYNSTLLEESSSDVIGYLNAKQSAGTLVDLFGSPINLNRVMGGVEYDSNGNILSAELLVLNYKLDNRKYVENGAEVDPPASLWEEELGDINTPSGMSTIVFNRALYRVESGGAIRGDLGLVGASIMMIIIYLCCMLGGTPCIQSRILLSFGGVLSVGASLGAAYGLGSLLSPSTPVHSVLPFLLFGIGVDDVFVLVNEFDLTSRHTKEDDLVTRMEKAMAVAGASMLTTSLTDFLAFMISSTTSLPALSSFCIWAAIAVFAAFVFTCTLFAGFLIYDMRRQLAGKGDCLCRASSCEKDCGEVSEDKTDGRIRRCLRDNVATTLAIPAVKGAVILTCVGVLAFTIAGVSQLEQNFRQEWFIPSDSYLQDYFTLRDEYFNKDGVPVGAYAENFDLYDHPNLFPNLKAAFLANEYVNTNIPVRDWHANWLEYVDDQGQTIGGLTDRTAFTNEFNSWLASPGARQYLNDIVIEEGSTLRIAKLTGFHVKLNKAADETVGMNSLSDDIEAVGRRESSKVTTWAFSAVYPSWAVYEVVLDEMITNIGFTLMAVFIIVVLLVPHPLMAVLVTVIVGLVLTDILGCMYWWGMYLDSVAIINLVLSIGLSVDYSVHIAHAFMHAKGDSLDERMKKALDSMGVSVLNGGISTFLAVVLLSFSKSYVFVVFFRMFFLTVVFGLFHGMIVLPVVLSLIGPTKFDEGDSHLELEKTPSELNKGDFTQ